MQWCYPSRAALKNLLSVTPAHIFFNLALSADDEAFVIENNCSSLTFLEEIEESIATPAPTVVPAEPGPELVSALLSGEGSGLQSNVWMNWLHTQSENVHHLAVFYNMKEVVVAPIHVTLDVEKSLQHEHSRQPSLLSANMVLLTAPCLCYLSPPCSLPQGSLTRAHQCSSPSTTTQTTVQCPT